MEAADNSMDWQRMVAVTVGYEHIVYVAKVDAQPLCITDKNVACSSIEQYLVPLRLQKD